jgi:thymidylate synthase (FAD)
MLPTDPYMTNENSLGRHVVPALDAILGRPFPVLGDGFVRLVDYMGSDEAIVQAARISYGSGTKRVHEDRGLIRYLMRHRHTTPFEMCELKLHVRVPMDTWRQWVRHRTASINEYSTRYSVAIDAAQRTSPGGWRTQATDNRQGSGGTLPPDTGQHLSAREHETQSLARTTYLERLEAGVAREQARKDLPLSTFTEAYWKADLHNLLHFLELRMDAGAQYEIREYARTIATEIVAHWCPVAWEAFTEYRLEATEFSKKELMVVRGLLVSPQTGYDTAISVGLLNGDGTRLGRSRELRELEVKLERLGLDVPWLK